MNLNRTRHLIAAILLSWSTAGLSAIGPAAASVPHRGITSATSYSNDFFEVRVDFTHGWTAMTDDELAGTPNELLGGPIRSLRSGVPLASLPQFPLAVLVNVEAGRGTQANVIVAAISLQGGNAMAIPMTTARVRDGARNAAGVKMVSPIYTEVLAGKTFRRFDTQVSSGRVDLTQHWYLAESHGYAILIITTGGTPADEEAIAALLNNFTFTPASSIARR